MFCIREKVLLLYINQQNDKPTQEYNTMIYFVNVVNQIEKGNIQEGQLYLVRDNILKRYLTEVDSTYKTTVIPRVLIGQILRLAHDELGHNGTHRTYTMLKRLYYWKGFKTKF